MPLYPLGICRSRESPCVPKQVTQSANMRWSVEGDLACILIDSPYHVIQPALHASVLDAIHRRICVLPVRFGVALNDEPEVRSMLKTHCREFLDHLDRLERTCEMGLRINLLKLPEPKAASSERRTLSAYLDNRRSHYERTDEEENRRHSIVGHFVEKLSDCWKQWRELTSSQTYPIRLAFLIERDRAATFQNRAEQACRTFFDGRCAVLGPWPPYSFV
jgi:hypothetical protein